MADHTLFNCYTILEISPRSSYDEIKSAFRALSKRSHPDVSGDPTGEAQIRLNLAFEVLADPILRERHDRFWNVSVSKRPKSWRAKKKSAPPETIREAKDDRTGRSSESTGTEDRVKRTAYEMLHERMIRETREKEKQIRASVNKEKEKYAAEYKKTFLIKRFYVFAASLLAAGLFAGCSFFPLAYIVTVPLCAFLLIHRARVNVEYDTIFVFAVHWKKRIERAAKLKADFSAEHELKNLRQYPKILKIIKEEMIRGSRFSDTEDAVIGRLALAFFLMGYLPAHFDRRSRIVRFTIADDIIFVRYRHRKGSATNIAYVKKMADLMAEGKARTGFIFSSPGLSGNALSYATGHNISSYTLPEMNSWIKNVYKSGYTGPSGSILNALDILRRFLKELARRE